MLLTLKDIYDTELGKQSAGAAYDDIDSIRVDPGYLMTIRMASAENKTNDFTRLQFGIAMGSFFYGLEDENTVLAANIYFSADYFLVPAGHVFRVRMTGCTAADILRCHLQGYIYLLGE